MNTQMQQQLQQRINAALQQYFNDAADVEDEIPNDTLDQRMTDFAQYIILTIK